MDAKEKSLELIEKYCKILFGDDRFVNLTNPKKCALIAVDEIIKSQPISPYNGGYYETIADRIDDVKSFFEEVKLEINKL